ncbi:hypothetical protein SEA_XENIA2_57 [Gordonia phage Xenia2]
MKFARCTECGEPCHPIFDTVSKLTASGEVEEPMCCDCYEEVYGEQGNSEG